MNQRLAIAVVVIAAALLIVGVVLVPLGMQVPRDLTAYGDVSVHSLYGGDDGGLGPALSSGDTIDAKDGLAVVWRPVPDYKGEPTCRLYSAGTWYEDGNWNINTNVDPYFHLWGFTLDTVPQGTTDFYCAFGGKYTEDIDWTGSTIHFNIYSGTVPEDTVVVFTEEPEDTSGAGGELITLRWWFVCKGAATGVITVDDVPKTPRTITASPNEQIFSCSFQEYTEGDYTVELTITPEYGDEVSSSCNVVVTTTVTTPTTTTTTDTDTTTTTTTDTDTTTTEPPPPEPDYLWVYALIAVVIIAIILLAKR